MCGGKRFAMKEKSLLLWRINIKDLGAVPFKSYTEHHSINVFPFVSAFVYQNIAY